MNDITFKPLTTQEIRAIEAEAQRLRAQAMAKMFRALFSTLAAVPRKLFATPRCARPLHP